MARTYRELIAWQLAEELRAKIVAETAPVMSRQMCKSCDQARDAAASVSANIAEGFGRPSAADFAKFLDYAVGSLSEIDTHLRDGASRGWLTTQRAAELLRLRARCDTATRRLRTNRRLVAREAKLRPRQT